MNNPSNPRCGFYFRLPLLVILAVACVGTARAATYTFDYPGRITSGSLAGQDNWVVLTGSSDSSDVIQAGTGSDTTNVMANPGAAGPTGVHRMGRTNDANFSFGSLVGATGLTLSFDTQVMNNVSISQDFINFALADSNNAHSSPAFSYEQINGGTPTWAIGSSGGSNSGSFPTSITTGDWIRLSLVMDFTANSGAGSGNLFYTDLTNPGGTIFLGSVNNLGNPTANEGLWTTMWSRSDNGPGAAVSHVVLDNLTITPSFTAVPEVSGAWIAAACALLIATHGARRYRARLNA